MRAAVSIICAGFLLSGCGAEGAAEPAKAPPTRVAPAGQVVPVGDQPEGLVADPVTHLVALGVRNPNGLVLLDGGSGRVITRIPLTGHLRHVQLAAAGGPVLVPNEDSGEVLTVDLPSGSVGWRIVVGRYPHDATATPGGTVAVADEFGKALVLVRDGRVVQSFGGLTQPGGVAAAGEIVGLVDVHDHILIGYDTTQRRRIGHVSAGEGPTHVIADRRGRLFVADTRGNRLLGYEATPRLRQVSSTSLPGTPYGLAYDPTRDRVWVTLTAYNQLVGFDLGGSRPREVSRIATVRQPNTVAVDAQTGRIFVAGRTDGLLQMIDQPG